MWVKTDLGDTIQYHHTVDNITARIVKTDEKFTVSYEMPFPEDRPGWQAMVNNIDTTINQETA